MDIPAKMEPAIIIVHGAWHTPQHYIEVINSLKQKGFKHVYCPRLPTMVSSLPLPPTANLKHDTVEIRSQIRTLADAGHPIVVLMHSYGGVVGNNSLDGLLWPQREAHNQGGGVVHLVYMAAFVIPVGTRLADGTDGKMPPWLEEDVENQITHMKDPRHAFYGHLESDEEAQKWLDKTVYCPSSVIWDAQDYSPYEHVGKGVDATYLVCTRDKELVTPVQEAMASLLGDARRMEYCDAGHCCMIGYGDIIADTVDRAWKTSKARLDVQ